MKSYILIVLSSILSGVLAAPTPTIGEAPSAVLAVAKRASSGSYTVSGLGSRKQAVLSAGGNSLDLAIAMLETENMSTNYAYGDNKVNDAANFGIFKQNWGMLRVCASAFRGQSQSQWNNGAKLKYARDTSADAVTNLKILRSSADPPSSSDLRADVTSRTECQNYYGYDLWFAGHRNGATGLANPNTPDINGYKSAIQWIKSQIDSNSKYRTDDTRFWVDVQPI